MSKTLGQWLHAILVGAGGAIILALTGVVQNTDPSSFTHDPIVLFVVAAVTTGVTRALGWLLGKIK